jgi:hypothetical protein
MNPGRINHLSGDKLHNVAKSFEDVKKGCGSVNFANDYSPNS